MIVGADIQQLRTTASGFSDAGSRLRAMATDLHHLVEAAAWSGADATRFRHDWPAMREQLASAAVLLEGAASHLRFQANDQEQASGTGSMGGMASGWAPGISAGTPLGSFTVASAGLTANGRQAVLMAVGAIGRQDIAQAHIGLYRFDNGRYLVVLPGVEDLSTSGEAFRSGGPGAALDEVYAPAPSGSVRDLKNTIGPATSGGPNLYADRVRSALADAGVPAGAEVMLVGHSAGAYAAVDLSRDPTFNGATDGYQVTHVVALAADTSWHADEIPAHTEALILNNRRDAAYQAENLLHAGSSPTAPNVTEINFWGGDEGWGHHPTNYSTWMTLARDRPTMDAFFTSVGHHYSGSGSREALKVLE